MKFPSLLALLASLETAPCFGCVGAPPMDIHLALDHSGSVGVDGWDEIRSFSSIFIDQVGEAYPNTSFGVSRFAGKKATPTQDPVGSVVFIDAPMSTSASLVKSQISSRAPAGWTPLPDGIKVAGLELIGNGRQGTRKVLVIVSDGVPRDGECSTVYPRIVYGNTGCSTLTDPTDILPIEASVNEATKLKDQGVLVVTVLVTSRFQRSPEGALTLTGQTEYDLASQVAQESASSPDFSFQDVSDFTRLTTQVLPSLLILLCSTANPTFSPTRAPTSPSQSVPSASPTSLPSFVPTTVPSDVAGVDCSLLMRIGGTGGLCGECMPGFVAAPAGAGNSVCQLDCSAFPPNVCSGLQREACGSDPSLQEAGCGACLFGFHNQSQSQNRSSSCVPNCSAELCELVAFRDTCSNQPFQCGSCQNGFEEVMVAGQQMCFNSTCNVSSYKSTDCPLSAYCEIAPTACAGSGSGSGDDCAQRNRLIDVSAAAGADCLGCLPAYLEPTAAAGANNQNGTCLPDCSVVDQFDICPKLHRADCDSSDTARQQPNSCGACQLKERWQNPPSGSPLEACVANCAAYPPARCMALRRQPCDSSSNVRPGCGDPLPGHAFPSPAAPAAVFHSYGAAIEGGLSEDDLLGLQAEFLCQVATPTQCASLHRGPCGMVGPNECGGCVEGFEFPQGSKQLGLDTCSPVKEALLSNAHIFIIAFFASLAVVLLVLFGWCRARRQDKSSKGSPKPLFMLLLFLLSFTLNLLFVYNASLQGYSLIFALSAAAIAVRVAAGVLASVQVLSTEMKASPLFQAWLSKQKALRLPMLVLGAINTDNLLLFSTKLGSLDALSAPLRAESEGMIEAKGLYAVLAGDLPLWLLHIPFVVLRHEEGVPTFVFFSMVVGFAILCVNIGKRWLSRVAHKTPPAAAPSPAGTSSVQMSDLAKAQKQPQADDDASGSDSHSDPDNTDSDDDDADTLANV